MGLPAGTDTPTTALSLTHTDTTVTCTPPTPIAVVVVSPQELDAPIHALDDDDYDDVDDVGELRPKTGVVGSVFSYVCTCVGAGVISLPGALEQVGWLGLLVMAIIAIGCNHTAKYLIACMFAKPGKVTSTETNHDGTSWGRFAAVAGDLPL